MYNKMINTQMRQFKKQKTNNQQQQFLNDDKENFLLNKLEGKQPKKKIDKKYLQKAESLILKDQLNQIVAHNLPYFRNILEADQLCKPNSHTLKLPSSIAPTLYRTDFQKRKPFQVQNASVDMKKGFFDRTKKLSQSKLPFKTTYQNQFKKIEQIQQKSNIRSKAIIKLFERQSESCQDAPSFLDTQNSLQYRNWGNGSVMPSMKPSLNAATTDAPFKANSSYRTDFDNVKLPKTKIITHEESFPHRLNLWMGNSSYEKDFNWKKVKGPEQPFRPKECQGATNLPFKSITEYKESFIETIGSYNKFNKTKAKKKQTEKLSDQEISKLVLDL